MECYIEYAILNNLMLDFLIVKTVIRILRLQVKKYRFIICLIFSSLFSVIFPLLNIGGIIGILLKMLCGLTMTGILGRYKDFKSFCIFYISLLLITFIYGGFCYVFLEILDSKGKHNYPLFLILLSCFLIYKLFIYIVLNVKKRVDISNFLYDVELYLNGKNVKIKAFLDTGNRLYDNSTLKPICVLEASVLFDLLDEDKIYNLFMSKKDTIKNKDMYVSMLNTDKEKLKIISLDKIKIYISDKVNILENVEVGVSFKKLFDELEYKMLIHPDIFNEG